MVGITEEKREKGTESLFQKIINEIISNLGKELKFQGWEANRSRGK